MAEFAVQILGCSSATPTKERFPSAQYLQFNGQNILIDCGEGTQMQMLKYGKRFQKLNTILISHLHGDHYFGLIGLVSTMSLQGRTSKLTIIGPKPLKEIIDLQIAHSGNNLAYPIDFIPNEVEEMEEIYKVGLLKISTFPLKHRIPCWGYVIEETKELFPLNVAACEQHNIPTNYFDRIKNGADYIGLDGNVIPNKELVYEKKPSIKYAYVSDTRFDLSYKECIQGVDILYHEATFLDELKSRAEETFHSTAREAGKMAKICGAKKLILGHFSARYLDEETLEKEAQLEFPNTIAGKEGMIVTLN